MGRLIDADTISFRCSYGGMCMGDIEDCKTCIHYVCDYEDIQNVPTAYDVEKVVEELEERKGNVIIDGKIMYQENYFIDIDSAIDIVKAGGVDD